MGEGKLTPERGVDAALFVAKQTGSLTGGTGGENSRFVTVKSVTDKPATVEPPGRMGAKRAFVVTTPPQETRPGVVRRTAQGGSPSQADSPASTNQRLDTPAWPRPPESGDVEASLPDQPPGIGKQVVHAGDKEGFARLVDETRGSLLRTALRSTRHLQNAQDDVDEALTRAWEAFLKGTDVNSSYLFTTLNHLNIDRVRSRERRAPKEALARNMEPSFIPSHEDEVVENVSGRDRMIEMLQGLHPTQQKVLFLRFYADMSPEEIVEATGMNPTTVRIATHRGLAHLKNLLAEE